MFNFLNTDPSDLLNEVVAKVQGKNIDFIDVRTESEYAAGHAKDARNLPLHTLGDHHAAELGAFEAVYVICQSGGRSAQAVAFLTSRGVSAINVPGGTSAWKSLGLPMT